MHAPNGDAGPATESRAGAIASAAVRGIAVGLVSIGGSFAAIWLFIHLALPDLAGCPDDLSCPDIGPRIPILIGLGVLFLLPAPLVARLLRLRRPWIFLFPGGWIVAGAWSASDSPGPALVIVLGLYALLAAIFGAQPSPATITTSGMAP